MEIAMNSAMELQTLTFERQARRAFLGKAGRSLGSIALASLLRSHPLRADTAVTARSCRGVIQPRHFAAKINRVIWLCMAGGPSQLETFDYKPQLARVDGQP